MSNTVKDWLSAFIYNEIDHHRILVYYTLENENISICTVQEPTNKSYNLQLYVLGDKRSYLQA